MFCQRPSPSRHQRAPHRLPRAVVVVSLLAVAPAVAPPVLAGSAPTITYTPLTNTSTTGNRILSGVVITDADGIQTTPGLRPRLYYKAGSDVNAFVGNTSSDSGWKYVETTDTTSPFSFTLDVSLLTGALAAGDFVPYFVVAQDTAVTPNVGVNAATFASAPSSVDLQPGQAPLDNIANAYEILTPLTGTKTACTSGCDYKSLTKSGGAFDTLDTSALTGDLDLVISGDLDEDGTSPLQPWIEDGVGGYTLTIRPDSATLRTISGPGDFPGLILLR